MTNIILCANGVLQFCDNKQGLEYLYDINKEVISFEHDDIKSLIKNLEYYLKNDNKRKQIAKNGYNKAINSYMNWQSFSKIIKYILEDSRYLKRFH